MRHYREELWIDFARGVAGSRDKRMIEKHLQAGCRQCEREAGFWKHVTELARRPLGPEPSPDAVRQAKALASNLGRGASRHAGRAVARLLFDSLSNPLAAGVRSGVFNSRQLLFATPDHRIDLRLEPQISSDKVSIIGQILNVRNPGSMPVKIAISLFAGRKLLGKTETNDLGEFEFECDLGGRLELRARLPEGRQISVFLLEPPAPTLEAASHLPNLAADNGPHTRGTRRKV
jgi:hypothetical protein